MRMQDMDNGKRLDDVALLLTRQEAEQFRRVLDGLIASFDEDDLGAHDHVTSDDSDAHVREIMVIIYRKEEDYLPYFAAEIVKMLQDD